jgi:hypothetical protein
MTEVVRPRTGPDAAGRTAPAGHTALAGLVEALDQMLDGGVSAVGDVIVSVAGVDLLHVDLRLLLETVHAEGAHG